MNFEIYEKTFNFFWLRFDLFLKRYMIAQKKVKQEAKWKIPEQETINSRHDL